MLTQYFLKLSRAEIAKNQERRRRIRTRADVQRRQRYVRRAIMECIGQFPARTPLNAQVVGRIQRRGYAIEKVIFESRPKLYVTASLYLPGDAAVPGPTVLSPCGHSADARFQATGTYQGLYISLVRNGYVVLVYDPLGQGERFQSWDAETNEFRTRPSTGEHCALGHQCVLAGTNIAQYRIWDGMRAIDYLESRPEVDRSRIACTGCSGGGTLTAYLTALDDRIAVSIPNCYITSFRHLFEHSSGPQDAEQCFTNMISKGIDHAELLLPFAPRPLQISVATEDFFPIAGARSTYRELKRMYRILGVEDRVSLAQDVSGHDYSPGLRAQAIRWLNRWFDNGDPVVDPEIDMIEDQQALWCTKTGQVATSIPKAKTVFDFSRQHAASIAPAKAEISSPAAYRNFRRRTLMKVKKVLALSKPACPLKPKLIERSEDGDLMTEELVFQGEPGIMVPCLAMGRPNEEVEKVIMLVGEDDEGHEHARARSRQLLSPGVAVLAVDVRYFGESFEHDKESRWRKTGFSNELGRGYYDAFVHAGWMLGRPLFGMQVVDAVRAVDYVRSRARWAGAAVAIHGVGDGALVALYAAALDRRIKEVRCEGMLASYRSVVMNRFYNCHPRVFLPGVVAEFDLDDVAALIAPRQLILSGLVDERREAITRRQARAAFATTVNAYRLLGSDTLAVSDA